MSGEVEFGEWLRIGDYVVPVVCLIDPLSVTISLFASVLTALVARFSRTYLHKEPGFVRFFGLLGLFATGTQLVAFAGALELFFAGWEIIGIASALFIGFFHERDEPVRSAVRAFSTYRLSDAGLLIATVTTFELLGSARFSSLAGASSLPAIEVDRAGAAVPAVGDGQVGAAALLGLAAAGDGRPHAVERALLRRRVDPRGPVPPAARLAGVRGLAGRARRRAWPWGSPPPSTPRPWPGSTPTPRARWHTPRWRRWG